MTWPKSNRPIMPAIASTAAPTSGLTGLSIALSLRMIARMEGVTDMQIGTKGLDLIKSFEGCAKKRADGHMEAYPDPAHASGDPWTIGWGSTGTDIHRGTVWTQQMCDQRLASDAGRFAAKVTVLLDGAATTQDQFDAMVSFAYNLGAGRLASSTLLRLHKAGKFAAAHDEFAKWCNAGGKRMAGLVRRRAAEAALYGAA